MSSNTETIFLILSCPFSNSETLMTSFNMTMQDVTWLVFGKTFCTRITSVFFLGRHYHRICHQQNIYGMNSVDVFATVKIHRKHYRSCVTHLCDWFYASEMRSCRCCKSSARFRTYEALCQLSYEAPYLGPAGGRPDRPTQAVRHTCSGKLGIVNQSMHVILECCYNSSL